ncbi:hypothetical protein PV326_007550 [Microctonus aethiopoides]|nr:hypothetical protein PV326_007550 [Microctonus aethiopoides]
MDQLVGPNVQVVLSLKEGKGFCKIINPTCIIATLNGLSLETDLINPDPNPQYLTDLVWEASKNALRKMRSGQEPLKIEYFELKENGTKDRIGYLLLSMRTAQIIARGNDHNLKTNWHQLSGLRSDVKADKPAFYISFTIEERDQFVNTTSSKRDLTMINKTINENDAPIPYLIDDEHLIQLGPINTCRDIFLLSIVTKKIANIDQLMSKSTCKSDAHKLYKFWYYILDNEVHSKSFTYYHQPRALDEKIVIRIRSCLNVMKNYFKNKSHCLVILKCGDHVLGQSEIDLRPLISADNIDDFLKNSNCGAVELNEHCFLKTLNTTDNTFNVDDKPYFDIHIKLSYTGMKTINNGSQTDTTAEIHQRPSASNYHPPISRGNSQQPMAKISDIDFHRHPGGDCQRCTTSVHEMKKINRISSFEHAEKHSEYIHTSNDREHTKTVEAYHCYCLHITLNSMKLKSQMTIKNIEFRFHHPKAEIMSTLYPKLPILSGEQLKLHDIGCKLHFISSAEKIRRLLLSFPPRVSVCDGDQSDKMCLGQLILDVGRVFDEIKLECQYEASLIDEHLREIGSIEIKMHLEDQGPYYRSNKRLDDENLGPPILDDSLAYKIVNELETWKERQQELFRIELKRKEERHLNRLSEEWQIRRESLESKLNCSVEQCKLLVNSLNDATDDLRARKLQSLEKEARLMKANEDLKWSYERKLQELEDASQKMQQDFTSKISLLEEQKKNLETQNEVIKSENERLEKILLKQNEEIITYKKKASPKNEIDNLLYEVKVLESKLNSAQKSKTFFKEQWGKAVREIHKMRLEHRQAIELQIKSSKEQLKNIDLERLLRVDSVALSNDKILLGQIQKEIDVIKPTPSFTSSNKQESVFTPSYYSVSRSLGNYNKVENLSSANEHEERLRKLIEERDSLLKTGSYTTDDAIIAKLNTEIRTLLITS